jgi:hypothetical protein
MKHWEQTFATYVYNHCNIHLKHLQHPLKHPKHFKHTLATCVFSTSQHLLTAWENGGLSGCGVRRRQQPDGARRQWIGCAARVSGCATWQCDSGCASQLTGPAAERRYSQAATHRAWQAGSRVK